MLILAAKVLAIAVLLVVTVPLAATMSYAAKTFAQLIHTAAMSNGMASVQQQPKVIAESASTFVPAKALATAAKVTVPLAATMSHAAKPFVQLIHSAALLHGIVCVQTGH